MLTIFACEGPDICVQVPVPAPALFAASVVELLQRFCVLPAEAVGSTELTVIFKVSLEEQAPVESVKVQTKA